jgi:hypothetical protein
MSHTNWKELAEFLMYEECLDEDYIIKYLDSSEKSSEHDWHSAVIGLFREYDVPENIRVDLINRYTAANKQQEQSR